MNYKKKNTEELYYICEQLKQKLLNFYNSKDYKWYLENINNKGYMLKHKFIYFFELRRLFWIENILSKTKADIDCIEYELYVRENTYVRTLR